MPEVTCGHGCRCAGIPLSLLHTFKKSEVAHADLYTYIQTLHTNCDTCDGLIRPSHVERKHKSYTYIPKFNKSMRHSVDSKLQLQLLQLHIIHCCYCYCYADVAEAEVQSEVSPRYCILPAKIAQVALCGTCGINLSTCVFKYAYLRTQLVCYTV